MTSLSKKIPVGVGMLMFGVAACVAMLNGAELPTAIIRGIVAGGIGTLFAWLPAYLIFSEPLAHAKAPPGMESMEEKFAANREKIIVPVKEEKSVPKKKEKLTPKKEEKHTSKAEE